MSITLEEADDAVGKEVVYLAGSDRAEHGILKGVNTSMLAGHVLYLGDRTVKLTYLRDLSLVTLEVAAVKRPDSSTQYLCDSLTAPTGATHRLVPRPISGGFNVQKCRYCDRTDAEIRKLVGLDVQR